MTDLHYKNLVDMFGQEYADALRKVQHTGSSRDLSEFLKVRRKILEREKDG